jgi:hypothetical protein
MLISTIIREVQIETTVSYISPQAGWFLSQRQKITSEGGGAQDVENVYTVVEN